MKALDLTTLTSLGALLPARVAASGDDPAYGAYDGTAWHYWSWRQAQGEVERLRDALYAEGLRLGDRVAICARNSAMWAFCDLAALSLGLVVVPLYANDRAENLVFCLTDADVRLLFIDHVPPPEVLACGLARIVGFTALEHTVALADWAASRAVAPVVAVTRADLATIVYTSGTTGRPKGVMLTHGNILADCAGLMTAIVEVVQGRHRFLSFLPLSHMFERTVAHFIAVTIDAETIYARGITELAEDLRTVRPTLLVSVPKIFERSYARIQARLQTRPLMARLVAATVAAHRACDRGTAGWGTRLTARLLDVAVGRRLRAHFGGALQYVFLGGAAAPLPLLEFFTGIGLRFLQGYGLTEAAPVVTCVRVGDRDLRSVGRPVPGVTVTFVDGELLVRGPTVMRGYWRNPDATAAIIDSDGWLHSGDRGYWVDGQVYLTGRVKDIIVLSSGEKVAPVDAEQAILMDPVFEQAVIIGEGRGMLGLIAVTTLKDERALIDRANRQLHAFPGYTRIRTARVVEGPWTVENGLLTPTLKVKRHEVEQRYAAVIAAMYDP
ncbi:MAG: AMP-dependent synthetase/ligase [Acidiferrobacter sp.]